MLRKSLGVLIILAVLGIPFYFPSFFGSPEKVFKFYGLMILFMVVMIILSVIVIFGIHLIVDRK